MSSSGARTSGINLRENRAGRKLRRRETAPVIKSIFGGEKDRLSRAENTGAGGVDDERSQRRDDDEDGDCVWTKADKDGVAGDDVSNGAIPLVELQFFAIFPSASDSPVRLQTEPSFGAAAATL